MDNLRIFKMHICALQSLILVLGMHSIGILICVSKTIPKLGMAVHTYSTSYLGG